MMFQNPELLWALPFILILLGLSVAVRTRRIGAMETYLSFDPKDRFWPRRLRKHFSKPRWLTKGVLLSIGGASLVGALAGFQVGDSRTPRFRPTSPLFLIVDISRSMAVEDVPWSRLGEAKLLIHRMTTRFSGASLALTVFAEEPYHLLPPGTDDGLLTLYVEALTTELVADQGTSIQPALAEAARLAREAPKEGKPVFILLSDGEDQAGDESLAAAASEIQDNGGTLATIAFGTRSGGRVTLSGGVVGAPSHVPEVPGGSSTAEPHSRADPELLRRLAEEGGGRFTAAGDSEGVLSLLTWLESALGQGEVSEGEVEKADRWSWLVLTAFLALLLESLLPGPFEERRKVEAS